jgi:protein phosphatase methylesterase 1
MGGSIACKATIEALNQSYQHRIQGLVVIDVVEGTAMEALPFMEKIVDERPKSFPSLEKAIEWRFSFNSLFFTFFHIFLLLFFL